MRSAGGVDVGQEIVTRFADGTARSRVEDTAIRNRDEENGEET
jgi:hypothetical protein